MRFCASCGFRLDGVMELLTNEGVPTNPLAPPRNPPPSPRKRGIRFGAKILFFSIVLFLPAFALAIDADHPGPLILPGVLFLAGIFWMLYYRLFGEESAPVQKQPQFISHATPQPVYLPPPQQSVPVTSHTPTPQPQSVAEHTTRSLGQQ
jgi:hypothetical protein